MWTSKTRLAFRSRIDAVTNIVGSPVGEAPRRKRILGDLTGIYTHLHGLEIIITLNKTFHGILSFKTLLIVFRQIPHQLSVSISLMDFSYKTIKTERTNVLDTKLDMTLSKSIEKSSL